MTDAAWPPVRQTARGKARPRVAAVIPAASHTQASAANRVERVALVAAWCEREGADVVTIGSPMDCLRMLVDGRAEVVLAWPGSLHREVLVYSSTSHLFVPADSPEFGVRRPRRLDASYSWRR